MKIDTAIRDFTEKYDRDAIQSIEDISHDLALNNMRASIKAFNMKECFDAFDNHLKGYTAYHQQKQNLNESEQFTNDHIRTRTKAMIDGNGMFKESDLRYSDMPAFVSTYVEGVRSLLKTVDESKSTLLENGVDNDAIADINLFTDMFMEKMNGMFESTMDKMLWASGYMDKKILLDGAHRPAPAPKQEVVFA